MRRRKLGPGGAKLLLVVLLLARPVAAHDNLRLWQAQPQRAADARNEGVLARSSALHVGFTLDPRLQWRRLDGPAQLRYGAALFAFAGRTLERPHDGLVLQLDGLTLAAASTDAAGSESKGSTGHLVRFGAQRAEATARGYWLGRAPNVFVGTSVGAYGAGLAYERLGGAGRLLAAWPLSAAAGVGYGRLLPQTPRVALALLERVLLADGVLAAPLPEHVGRALLELWMDHAADLGDREFVVQSLAQLQRAQLLRGPLGVASSYRVERIVQTWLRRPTMPRWRGSESWLALRLTHVVGQAVRTPYSLTLELRGRGVFNRSLTDAVWVAPSVAWTPRAGDRVRGVPVAGLPVVPLGPPTGADLLQPQAVRIELPLGYERLLFDPYYNPRGTLVLQGSLAIAATRHAEVGLHLGGAYTSFFSGTHGLKVGVVAAAAATQRGPVAQLQLVAAYLQGSGYGNYVAPGPVPAAPSPALWGRGP